MTPRILLLLLLAFAGLALPLETRAPGPSAMDDGATTATATFAAGFLEHLESVRVAVDALVELGARRERNLLVVGQQQSAMNAALSSTDTWLAQQAAHQDDRAVAAYRSGADDIRQAMADAQSAFLHFDWDGIAAANDTLKRGAAEVAVAEGLLKPADGP